MTVLEQYRRLEATGLWRVAPDDQRREVIVALGDATLMITDSNEMALAHWSLPAVHRINPGRRPAVYTPGPDAEERLEIDDGDMISAIEAVRTAIDKQRPKPGRLRLWIGLGVAAACLVAAVLWLPGALTRQTVALLPMASRIAIGDQLLTEIARLAGPICRTPRGSSALRRLTTRSFGVDDPPRVAVLPTAIPNTIGLPGNIFVVNAALVEDFETPSVLAGYLLAEDVRTTQNDPMLDLLTEAGLPVTFRLLTTGEIDRTAVHEHAARLLSRPRLPVPNDMMLDRFAVVDISTEPYAYAQDVSGETVLGLIEANPVRTGATPLLPDADWVSLQDICAR